MQKSMTFSPNSAVSPSPSTSCTLTSFFIVFTPFCTTGWLVTDILCSFQALLQETQSVWFPFTIANCLTNGLSLSPSAAIISANRMVGGPTSFNRFVKSLLNHFVSIVHCFHDLFEVLLIKSYGNDRVSSISAATSSSFIAPTWCQA